MLIVLGIIIQILAVLWALVTKVKARERFEMIAVAVCGAGLILHSTVCYHICYDLPVSQFVQFMRFFLLSLIVPIAYMYFARKVGRRWNSYVICMLWLVVCFIFFPYLVLVVDWGTINLCDLVLQPFMTYFVYQGRPVFEAYTSDIIMLVQSTVTGFILVQLLYMMRKYGMKFSRRVNIFFSWWGIAVIYIVATSFITPYDLDTIILKLLYFGVFFAVTVAIFVMVALNFDMNPLVMALISEKDALLASQDDDDDTDSSDTDGNADSEDSDPEESAPVEENVSFDAFVALCHEMAAKLRVLIYEEKAYRNPAFRAEDAIQYLGTNRTYFARMMNAEFGCKFSDLINEERLKMAHELLRTSNRSIAEIAAECGFSDASYLSKKFSAKYGVSPKQFRNAD